MQYVNYVLELFRKYLTPIRLAVLGFVLIKEFRAVLVIGLAVAFVYYVSPEVRPYWNEAFQHFVGGFRQIF